MGHMSNYRQAAISTGRPLASLVLEALKLRTGNSRLGLSEYIDFRLYENDLTFAEKSMFGGNRMQAVLEDILIDDYSRFLSLDKVTMYGLLRGYNLPIPEVRASYKSQRPATAGIPSLQSPDELERYLRRPGSLPVYIKRSFGSYGRGNALVVSLDGDTLLLGNGVHENVAEFCCSLDDARSLGWILQDPLSPDPVISELTQSEKISGVRVHTFVGRSGVDVTRAIFKINVGRDSDNFEHGASGNMLGAVDIDTGTVTRVIAGVGPGQRVDCTHPGTGRKLVGFKVPHWAEVRRLVIEAQTAFPGFICPGWDIALCADGPKILEINSFGDIDLSQHAYRRGFVDDKFVALLAQRGLDGLLGREVSDKAVSPANNRRGGRKHHWQW